MISTRKHWISTDGWRGYEQPISAVCGANNTGNSWDSPCPSNTCDQELRLAGSILRQNGIRYKRTWCRSSNVFCVHGYLCVEDKDIDRAKDLIRPLIDQTRLLYLA